MILQSSFCWIPVFVQMIGVYGSAEHQLLINQETKTILADSRFVLGFLTIIALFILLPTSIALIAKKMYIQGAGVMILLAAAVILLFYRVFRAH